MGEQQRLSAEASGRDSWLELLNAHSAAQAALPDPHLVGRIARPGYRFSGYRSVDDALAATALDGRRLRTLGQVFVAAAQRARTTRETAAREAAAYAAAAGHREQAPAGEKRRGLWNRIKMRVSTEEPSNAQFQEQLEAQVRHMAAAAIQARNPLPAEREFTGLAADQRAAYVIDRHAWMAGQEHLRADLDRIAAAALESMAEHYGRLVPGTELLATAAVHLREAGTDQGIHAMHSETRLALAARHAIAVGFSSTGGAAYEDFSRDAIPKAAKSLRLMWKGVNTMMTAEALDEITEIVQSEWALRADGYRREAAGYRAQLTAHDRAFSPNAFVALAADRRKLAGAILEDLAQGRTAPSNMDAFEAHVRMLDARTAELRNRDPGSLDQGAGTEPVPGVDARPLARTDHVGRIIAEADTAVDGLDASLARTAKQIAAGLRPVPGPPGERALGDASNLRPGRSAAGTARASEQAMRTGAPTPVATGDANRLTSRRPGTTNAADHRRGQHKGGRETPFGTFGG